MSLDRTLTVEDQGGQPAPLDSDAFVPLEPLHLAPADGDDGAAGAEGAGDRAARPPGSTPLETVLHDPGAGEGLEQGLDAERHQFTLVTMFAVTALCAVVFSLGSGLDAGAFAFWTGLAALAGMIAFSFSKQPSSLMRLTWWTLLGIYLTATVRALVAGL